MMTLLEAIMKIRKQFIINFHQELLKDSSGTNRLNLLTLIKGRASNDD